MRFAGHLAAPLLFLALAACQQGGQAALDQGPYPPALDPSKQSVDGLIVGHRLMDAGEYELALDAFLRAAGDNGLTPEVLSGLGSANLALGRLGQAENFLRQAAEADNDYPEAWNNLGVVLMEQNKIPEAQLVFQKAYALDNGESDAIRDNLRLALAKSEKTAYGATQQQEYKLVRRGSSDYLIRKTP